MANFSDKELLEGIKNSDNRALKYLYTRYFTMIRKLILNNSGELSDAEDVFQDAVVIIYEKLINDELVLTCALRTYLYGVCRNIWLQQLSKRKKTSILDDIEMEKVMPIVIESNEYMEEERLFHLHYSNLNTNCKKLLELFFSKVPYKEIASKLNLSISNVKTSKFRCKEILFNSIKNDPIYIRLKSKHILKKLR